MGRVLLFLLFWDWTLGQGIATPLQPEEAWSSSCNQLDCSQPGLPLGDWSLSSTSRQAVSNGIWNQLENDWGFYALLILVVVGNLVLLCFHLPIRRCLDSIWDHFRGINRSQLRNSLPYSRSHPRNYGTLTEITSQSSDPEDAPGRAEGKADQGEQEPKEEAKGERTDHEAASEMDVEDLV